jgi:hypothetical protein
MSQELTTTTVESNLLDFITDAVTDPAIDVAKLQALLTMQKQILDEHARLAYNAAMNACQAEITPIARATENTVTRSKFAKLEAIEAAIRPIYLKHGFAVTYDTGPPLVEGNIRVLAHCSHSGGDSRTYGREAPPDTMGMKGAPAKTALHGAASTETFLKRYLLCGIFAVVFRDQDDDGVKGGKTYIGGAAIKRLRELIAETNADTAAVCRAIGVPSLVEIPVDQYPRALNVLEARKRRSAEGTARVPPKPPGKPAEGGSRDLAGQHGQDDQSASAGSLTAYQPTPQDIEAGRKAAYGGTESLRAFWEAIPPGTGKRTALKLYLDDFWRKIALKAEAGQLPPYQPAAGEESPDAGPPHSDSNAGESERQPSPSEVQLHVDSGRAPGDTMA